MAITLCHINDIPDGAARGFELPQANLFGVRKRDRVFLYLNRCPHLGIPLEWEPDSFLDSEGLFIRCTNHGAFFNIEDGQCIQGPCRGDALWAINYTVVDDFITVEEESLPGLPGQA